MNYYERALALRQETVAHRRFFHTNAEKVPSAFIYLAAGYPDERGAMPAHNPKVRFNEDVCPIGAAAYAHCAEQWLKEHS